MRVSVPSGLFRVNPEQDAAPAGWKTRSDRFPASDIDTASTARDLLFCVGGRWREEAGSRKT